MSTVAEWGQRRTIILRVKRASDKCTEGAPFSVHGYVFGEWAAHPAVVGGLDGEAEIDTSKWSVTHVPSGRQVPRVETEKAKAIAIASVIAGRMGTASFDVATLDHQRIMVESVEIVLPSAYAGVRFEFR